jgi:hypothetical protein
VSSKELSRFSFDFLCFNQLICLLSKEQKKEKDESINNIGYIKTFQASELEDASIHDDWISVCHSLDDTIQEENKISTEVKFYLFLIE